MTSAPVAAPVTLIEAVTQALAWELQHDPTVLVLGEDVGVNGGVFRATAGLQQRFGAQRVLARMGLDDARAHEDLSELRDLLAAWRDAKRSAWRAFVSWAVRGALALLLIGLAYRFGFSEMLS